MTYDARAVLAPTILRLFRRDVAVDRAAVQGLSGDSSGHHGGAAGQTGRVTSRGHDAAHAGGTS